MKNIFTPYFARIFLATALMSNQVVGLSFCRTGSTGAPGDDLMVEVVTMDL